MSKMARANTTIAIPWIGFDPPAHMKVAHLRLAWRHIVVAPQDSTRLMLWRSGSQRPLFESSRGGSPNRARLAAEPCGQETLLETSWLCDAMCGKQRRIDSVAHYVELRTVKKECKHAS